jgi:RNA binding exosome subunit
MGRPGLTGYIGNLIEIELAGLTGYFGNPIEIEQAGLLGISLR